MPFSLSVMLTVIAAVLGPTLSLWLAISLARRSEARSATREELGKVQASLGVATERISVLEKELHTANNDRLRLALQNNELLNRISGLVEARVDQLESREEEAREYLKAVKKQRASDSRIYEGMGRDEDARERKDD